MDDLLLTLLAVLALAGLLIWFGITTACRLGDAIEDAWSRAARAEAQNAALRSGMDALPGVLRRGGDDPERLDRTLRAAEAAAEISVLDRAG